MAVIPVLLATTALLPSPATVEGGGTLPPAALLDIERCAECHPDVFAQWQASAHRHSSFSNPFYAAAVNALRRERGARPARFCAGCHDPALLLTGKFDRLDEQSEEAQAGLTCLVCHRVAHVPDTTGNGNYRLTKAPPSFDTKRPPGEHSPHAVSLLAPLLHTGEFCATCHKVSLPVALNGDRWRRGQNEYDAWHQSAVAGHSARAYYPAAQTRRCQDCHMPLESAPHDAAAKNGMIRSHRFIGANTALPFLRKDSDMLARTEAFLRDGKVVVDIFALRRGGIWLAPLDEQRPVLLPGETVEADVVVRNLGVGHAFPGGTNDSNQAWLDVRLLLGDRLIARDQDHLLSAVLLDGQARPVQHRNVEDFRATAHVHAVPPGSARLARYRFTVPADAAAPLRFEAALRWRKFQPAFSRFACRERPRDFPLGCPDLPVTTIAQDAVTFGATTGTARGDPRPRWQRFSDWGIALLAGLPEQVADAREAFRRAGRPVDEARVEIRLGRLDRALALLESAPPSTTVRLLRAEALLGAWRFAEASIEARAVAEAMPLEREAWRLLALALGPAGRPSEAVQAADRALAIDPEWTEVHLVRQRALLALGDEREAERARAAYLRYRVDESEAHLRERYLRRNGRRDTEDLAVHVHDLKEARR